MSASLLAEFSDADRLLAAVREVRREGHRVLDAFTPFPVEGLAEEVGFKPSPVRYAMLFGGLAVAAFAYWLQWFSATIDYPINSGGRPLHSWPVFLLVPYEVGVFAAAVAGFVAFLWASGMPRLNDPLFAVPGFERATNDRFFLLAEALGSERSVNALRRLLERTGAIVVTEVHER